MQRWESGGSDVEVSVILKLHTKFQEKKWKIQKTLEVIIEVILQ